MEAMNNKHSIDGVQHEAQEFMQNDKLLLQTAENSSNCL
jgi:hypothetical protein